MMLTLMSLWMPILVSAVVCWIAGAVIWMALPHHKTDFAKVDDEQASGDALRKLRSGQYNIPHISDPSKMTEADKKKFTDGPVVFLTVLDKGLPNMGKSLAQQFIYYVVVSSLIAYVASATLSANTDYLKVFQVVGTTAWLAYGFSTVQDSIWFGRPWSFSIKIVADALIYALLTAGIFGWLWPTV